MTQRSDGVDVRFATKAELDNYANMAKTVERFDAPRLYDSKDPSVRVFVALFDGTGNDVFKDPKHPTNVAHLRQQLEDRTVDGSHPHLGWHYKEGPGTQGGLTGVTDGAFGHTYKERIEHMYETFNKTANKWLAEDPNVKIRVVSVGFSRGAEQAAGFAREIHERGVENLANPSENLVDPGKIPQALALYDPVGTGVPLRNDRRPPPSVVSGLQLSAADEKRELFPSSQIFPPGESKDGRFLQMTGAGAHSNVGGSYDANGISSRTFNITSTYLNKVLGEDLIQKLPEPTDKDMNVVHNSVQHKKIYNEVEERRIIQHKLAIEPVDRELLNALTHKPAQEKADGRATDAPTAATASAKEDAKGAAPIIVGTIDNGASKHNPGAARFSQEDVANIANQMAKFAEWSKNQPETPSTQTSESVSARMRDTAAESTLAEPKEAAPKRAVQAER